MSKNTFIKAERMQQARMSQIVQLSEQAQRMIARGIPVINLCVGEPDFNTPEHVKQAAEKAMLDNQTKYTATSGTDALKAAVCEKFLSENNTVIHPSEVLISNGAKQVLFNAFFASLDDSDEIIVPAPYWTSYLDMIRVCGGVSKIVSCDKKTNFKITPELLEKNISSKTRWLILNSPSNPTGAVYSPVELRAIADVLAKYPHVWIVTDEIYEHLVYGDQQFQSFRQAAPELASRTLIINGVSKAYAMTGWRVGYGIGPKDLINTMTSVQNYSTSNVCSIAQAAAIAALTGPKAFLKQRCQAFKNRRNLIFSGLNNIAGLNFMMPDGAFYAFVDYSGLIGSITPDKTIIRSSLDFCEYILRAANVAIVPGDAFGAKNFFRLSYAADTTELQLACQRIQNACENLNQEAVA